MENVSMKNVFVTKVISVKIAQIKHALIIVTNEGDALMDNVSVTEVLQVILVREWLVLMVVLVMVNVLAWDFANVTMDLLDLIAASEDALVMVTVMATVNVIKIPYNVNANMDTLAKNVIINYAFLNAILKHLIAIKEFVIVKISTLVHHANSKHVLNHAVDMVSAIEELVNVIMDI
jgi:hypothetical protein